MKDLESQLPATPYDEVIGALNPSQRTSALSDAKVIRNVAGPGTGKTKTMQTRVAHLLHKGTPPESILALSFTNESAGEFKSRVEQSCGWQGFKVKVGTFHAVFNQELRKHSKHPFMLEKLGYDSFFIIDSDDQNKLFNEQLSKRSEPFKALVSAFGLERKSFFSELSKIRAHGLTPNLFFKMRSKDVPSFKQEWQSFIKTIEQMPPSEVQDYAAKELSANPELRNGLLITLWSSYSQSCKSNHAMDFDDVLCNFYYLIKYNPDVTRKIANKYSHILIDEYQDSNFIQVAIIRELARANPNLNIFLVGDPRQSIYGFRSADVGLMVNAERYFGETVTHEIDTNYRSSPELLSFSNCFAKEMAGQITQGQLNAGGLHHNILGSPIKLAVHRTDVDEALHTISSINEYISKGVKPEDIYVLYRTRTGVKTLEDQMKKHGIEYDMIGELNFWQYADVKDIASFIRILARPKDILAWARAVDATKIGVRDFWLRDNYQKNEGQVSPKELVLSRVNARNRDAIEQFTSYIELYQTAFSDGADITAFTEELYPEAEPETIKHYVNTNPEYREQFRSWRVEFIGEICDAIAHYWLSKVEPQWLKTENQRNKGAEDLETIVEDKMKARRERVWTLITNMAERLMVGDSIVDIADDMMTRVTVKKEEDRKCVKLMTGHASKGLESKVVFMIANENEIWYPNAEAMNLNDSLDPALDVNDELAEAQRLYYVMHTRASNHLHMSYADSRLVNGKIRNCSPLTMMTKHVDLFKQREPLWESVIDIQEYPTTQSAQQSKPTPTKSTVSSSFDINQFIEDSNDAENSSSAFQNFIN
ncbi:ATP-dependent helicase [Vibrio parahaemolyticus]|uniref:ATP-dependent helicase n=1 Tax=Vibrio parahaemolyticus TaxID=670 RepID=UPI0008132987|nr:ATP-dependent helicase [Vibrio parahaemolyticus]OCP68430.1 hypothetical protein AKH08_16605 [Vibrio parahaemolyticus]